MLKWSIGRALKKPSPNKIPLSNPEKLRKRDYYTVNITGSDGSQYLARSLSGDKISALKLDPDSEKPEEVNIDLAQVQISSLRITRYFAELEHSYQSPVLFIMKDRALFNYIALIVSRMKLKYYSKKSLYRADRIDVLRKMVERELSIFQQPVSSLRLMYDIHGVGWGLYRNSGSILFYYENLLESLADAGDLIKNGNAYRAAPQAMTTLARYEEEERRHRDQVIYQRTLAYLTAALVLVGFMQTIFEGVVFQINL